jgi:hypothetical protein
MVKGLPEWGLFLYTHNPREEKEQEQASIRQRAALLNAMGSIIKMLHHNLEHHL